MADFGAYSFLGILERTVGEPITGEDNPKNDEIVTETSPEVIEAVETPSPDTPHPHTSTDDNDEGDQNSQKIIRLEQENSKLQEEVEDLKKKVGKHENQAEKLTTIRDSLLTQLSGLQEEKKTIYERLTETDLNLDDKTEEVTQLTKLVKEMQSQMIELSQALDLNTTDKQNLQIKVKKMEADLFRKDEKISTLENTLREKEVTFKTKVVEVESERDELIDEMNRSFSELRDESEKEIAELRLKDEIRKEQKLRVEKEKKSKLLEAESRRIEQRKLEVEKAKVEMKRKRLKSPKKLAAARKKIRSLTYYDVSSIASYLHPSPIISSTVRSLVVFLGKVSPSRAKSWSNCAKVLNYKIDGDTDISAVRKLINEKNKVMIGRQSKAIVAMYNYLETVVLIVNVEK